MIAKRLVSLALAEVGVREVGNTNCGRRVNQYKAATNLPEKEAWPWCAAFICWLVRQAMWDSGERYTFQRPTTAGAWALEDWSRCQDDSTRTRRNPGGDILPGDIVIFTFSHVGIAVKEPRNFFVQTVEGNTDSEGSREGGGVFKKQRKLSQIRSRIRFTV